MFARTSLAALGMVGAFALGLVVGPHFHAPDPSMTPAAPAIVSAPEPDPTPAPVKAARPKAARESVRAERLPSTTSPAVQRNVIGLLNRGANPAMAADGFADSRELITVAHAARNTDIPFVLLKHRVLEQKMTLAAAINASRPDLDETAEANRARAEARADLAQLDN